MAAADAAAAKRAAERGDVVEAAVQRDLQHAAVAVLRVGQQGAGVLHARLAQKVGKAGALVREQPLHLARGEVVQACDVVQVQPRPVEPGADVALDERQAGRDLRVAPGRLRGGPGGGDGSGDQLAQGGRGALQVGGRQFGDCGRLEPARLSRAEQP